MKLRQRGLPWKWISTQPQSLPRAQAASVAGVGDVNNDLIGDFAVGYGNTVYLYEGQIGLSNFAAVSLTSGDALTTFNSADSQPAIVGLGDVNGDSIDDFVFSDGNGPTVVFGNSLSTQNLGGFSPFANGFISAAGDVDRDGQNDLLIGNANGDAYLILGSNLNNVEATLTGVDSAASSPFAAGSDVNSDAASDLLLVPSAAAAAESGLEGFGPLSLITQSMLPVASFPRRGHYPGRFRGIDVSRGRYRGGGARFIRPIFAGGARTVT